MPADRTIFEGIATFEAACADHAARRAAILLENIDPTSESTVEDRENRRDRYARAWVTLLSAIDRKRDPAFDPHDPMSQPSSRTILDEEDIPIPDDPNDVSLVTPAARTDPAAKARFEAKKKATSARNLYLVEQGKLYRLDRDLTRWAEEYFTTAFIRSKESMRAVEACTAQAAEARRTQILSWVTP